RLLDPTVELHVAPRHEQLLRPAAGRRQCRGPVLWRVSPTGKFLEQRWRVDAFPVLASEPALHGDEPGAIAERAIPVLETTEQHEPLGLCEDTIGILFALAGIRQATLISLGNVHDGARPIETQPS